MPTSRHRFTLVELLVVIAIIAVLAAMLLPALSQAREHGRRAVCMGNQRQFGIGLLLYSEDYADWFPGARYSIRNRLLEHQVFGRDYGINRPIVSCPSGYFYTEGTKSGLGPPDPDEGYYLNAANPGNSGVASIGYWYLGGYGDHNGAGNQPSGWEITAAKFPLRSQGIRPTYILSYNADTAATTPILFDASYWIVEPPTNPLGYGKPPRSNHPAAGTIYAAGENMLRLDGHATWISLNYGQGETLFSDANWAHWF